MSRIATDWAWKQELSTSTLKLLLLALSDRADENHCCFPSIARLVKDTGLNEKTVNSNIRKLESLGFITDTGRRKGITGKVKVYRINGVESYEKANNSKSGGIKKEGAGKPLNQRTPEGQKCNTSTIGGIGENDAFNTPKNGSLNTPKIGSMNTPKNGSQNQSLEPVIEPKENKSKNLDFSCWPNEPSSEVLGDWISMRKKKKLSVSQTVIKRLATELGIAAKNGVSVDDCLSECVVRGWQGFEYSWLSDEVKSRAKSNVHSIFDAPSFAETGMITDSSSRKDVGLALLAGFEFRALPSKHKEDLLKEWRAGRLRLDLVSLLERQNIAV